MARHVQQAELPLVRARVPLLEDEEPAKSNYAKRVEKMMSTRAEREDDEIIQVRLPTKVAQAVQADPGAAVRALAKAGEEMLAGITAGQKEVGQAIIDGELRTVPPNQAEARTGWPANEDPAAFTPWFTTDKPHWPGFYDVTDVKTGTLNARWWWDGLVWCKGHPDDKVATRLRHDHFVTQYAWRGLRAHSSVYWIYTGPPYKVRELPPGAPFSSKYVKRAALQG